MQLLDITDTQYLNQAIALAAEFATTAAARDRRGGTAKKAYGGIGETWVTAMKVVREFAKADSSIAHILGYSYIQGIESSHHHVHLQLL